MPRKETKSRYFKSNYSLTESDNTRLEKLAARYGLTKTSVLRSALMIAERIADSQIILLDGREWQPMWVAFAPPK